MARRTSYLADSNQGKGGNRNSKIVVERVRAEISIWAADALRSRVVDDVDVAPDEEEGKRGKWALVGVCIIS